MDERPADGTRRLTRRRLLTAAGGAAAAAGLVTLPGCGGDGELDAEQAAVENAPVDAPQLRAEPAVASREPLNCQLLGFFTTEEARTVEAFTARLLPGTPDDPGAREACVTGYIDRKLAEFDSFATTTYFKAPFAKPAKGRPPGFDDGTIYVAEAELPRYGFQSGQTPQQAYRAGLRQLGAYTRRVYAAPFVGLPERLQDRVIEALEGSGVDPTTHSPAEGKLAKRTDVARDFEDPSGYGFFSMLLEDTYEGMFADPVYGGNREYAGWRLIGYPGAQRAWTPQELKTGPRERTIQGLREMHAMHPGVPAEHVILPIEGTRRLAEGGR
jgi:gluconate 2-dehydrogenase gamma chain